jgi:hypothetical protein
MTIKDFLERYVSLRGIEMLKEYSRLYSASAAFDVWKQRPVDRFVDGFDWDSTPFGDDFRRVNTDICIRKAYYDAGDMISRMSRQFRSVSLEDGGKSDVFINTFLTPVAASWVRSTFPSLLLDADSVIFDWVWATPTLRECIVNKRYLDAGSYINRDVSRMISPTAVSPTFFIPDIPLPHPDAEPENEENAGHKHRVVVGDDLESVLIALSKHAGLSRNDKDIRDTVKQFLRRRA